MASAAVFNPKKGFEEDYEGQRMHRIRITLSARNVKVKNFILNFITENKKYYERFIKLNY
jgi:hypothetical protein